MSKTLRQNGGTIDHTVSGSAISSGDVVVIGAMVTIAMTDGAVGDSIACAVAQVHELPKVDAAVIAAGETVDWDVSAGTGGEVDDNAAASATGDVSDFGIAWETKGATTGELIEVLLVPGLGTLN